jgi:hypothetical protein
MTGGSFSATKGPLLYGTNANSTVTLESVTVSHPSDTLIWVDSASKGGGTINLIAINQSIYGTANADKFSKFTITLKNSSTWTGDANKAKTAKNVSVTLDASSSWIVTGESHVTFMTNAGISEISVPNITGNGFNVFYTPASSSSLGGKTFSLKGGGFLLPEGNSSSNTVMKQSSPTNASNHLIQFAVHGITSNGSVSFNPAYSAMTKTVALYDISGKLLDVKNFRTNTINIHSDFGAAEGLYIVKITGLKF